MSYDFGPYGKGLNGYVHYTQAFNESQKSGGGGKRPSSNSGCLTAVISALAVVSLIVALLAY